MMPTVNMRQVFNCRRKHVQLLRIWSQIPDICWGLTVTSGIFVVMGFRVALALDPRSPDYASEEVRALALILIGLMACVVAIVCFVCASRSPRS